MSNDNYTGRNLYRVEVDATRVNELLKRLNDKEAKKAISSALRKSILIIRKQAQENLVSAVLTYPLHPYRFSIYQFQGQDP